MATKKETRWTRGPWRAEGPAIYTGRGYDAVATVCLRDRREEEANARLIAAALLMEEALRKADENHDAALHGNRLPHNDLALAKEIRAALRAARGEGP